MVEHFPNEVSEFGMFGQQAPEGRRLRMRMWWIGLIAVVVSMMLLAGVRSDPEVVEEPARHVSLQLRLLGRYAVGAARMMRNLDASDRRTGVGGFLVQIDAQSRHEIDRLRAAPLHAELEDAEAAVAQLERLIADELDEPLLRDALALLRLYRDGRDALSDEARQALIDRHGWFAELACAYGLPDDHPDRKRALAPAARMLVLIALIGTGVGLTFLAGLVLFVVALVLFCTGRIRMGYARAPGRPDGEDLPLLEAFVIYLAAMLLLGLGTAVVEHLAGIEAGLYLVVLVVAVPFWPLLRGMTWQQLARSMGWHRGRDIGWEIGAGLLAYLAGLPLVAAGLVITIILSSLSGVNPEHPVIYEAIHAEPWKIVMLFVLAGIWAPLVEESMFRGAFYHHLRGRMGAVLSALIVGVVFAAIHPQGLVGLPVLASIGIVFALIREWRGSIIGSMAAHAVHNTAALTVLVLIVG